MTRRFLFLAMLWCVSCSQRQDIRMRGYFNAQWQERLSALRTSGSRDTITALALHADVANIIAVTKDIENPRAAVEMSRKLLDSYCAGNDFNRADFPDLDPDMSPDEMEMQLRENELGILNRLVMKDSTGSASMFSAH